MKVLFKSEQYPPASACQWHASCGFRRPSAFQHSSDTLSAINHPLLSCLRAQNSMLFSVTTRPTLDPLQHRKSMNLQACFQGNKNQKTCSQSAQETTQFNSEIIKNEMFWCNIFNTECYTMPAFSIPHLRYANFQKQTHKRHCKHLHNLAFRKKGIVNLEIETLSHQHGLQHRIGNIAKSCRIEHSVLQSIALLDMKLKIQHSQTRSAELSRSNAREIFCIPI